MTKYQYRSASRRTKLGWMGEDWCRWWTNQYWIPKPVRVWIIDLNYYAQRVFCLLFKHIPYESGNYPDPNHMYCVWCDKDMKVWGNEY